MGLVLGSAPTWSCSPTEVPQRDCRMVVWDQPDHPNETLYLTGSWSEWASPGQAMSDQGEGWQAAELQLGPGSYRYAVSERGELRPDPENPLLGHRRSDAQEVSYLEVPDCTQPELRWSSQQVQGSEARVELNFLAGTGGAALDPRSVQVSMLEGGGFPRLSRASAQDGSIVVELDALQRGRQRLEVVARDEQGRPARLKVALWVQPEAERDGDELIYQVLVDRFRDADGQALAPPPAPALRAGGSLPGVQAELEAGWFEKLGVSTLWLSPVYANPETIHQDPAGNLYDAYHGYWVQDSRGVEAKIGGEAALRSLIDAAHDRGIKVVFDLIPNHVYIDNPIWTERPDDDWFNLHDGLCECGTPSCTWAEHQQDCWFTGYLPDLRLEHPEAIDWSAKEVAWWVDSFNADGVRIDAVPMMPRSATRRVVHELEKLQAPPDESLTLGEVFTGPAGLPQLAYYLGPDSLDSVFDFPLMWQLRAVIAEGSQGFELIEQALQASELSLEGSQSTLARIVGNHDAPRFLAAATGEAHADPWTAAPVQPEDSAAYQRLALAYGLILTLPGIPVIFQGDELGLTGADDPDSRRVMPSIEELSPPRLALLEQLRALGQLRRCSEDLRHGERMSMHAEGAQYLFARGRALVAINASDAPATIALDPADLEPWAASPPTELVLGSGSAVFEGQSPRVELPPLSMMVRLPPDDACLP